MLDLEITALIGAMTWTAVAFLKHLRVKAYFDAATLVVIIGVAIGVTFLVQASGRALAGANGAEVVLTAYSATSVLRVGYETIKAIGGAYRKEPKLLGPVGSDA